MGIPLRTPLLRIAGVILVGNYHVDRYSKQVLYSRVKLVTASIHPALRPSFQGGDNTCAKRSFFGAPVTLLKSALPRKRLPTLLESTLPESLHLKANRINTYGKMRGRSCRAPTKGPALACGENRAPVTSKGLLPMPGPRLGDIIRHSEPAILLAGGPGGSLRKLFVLAMVVAALTLGTSRGAVAQDEITVLAPGSIRQALGKLAPMYQQKTGHAVKVTFGSGAEPSSRPRAGTRSM